MRFFKRRKHQGLTLPELLIVSLFLTLLLWLTSYTLTTFLRARSRVGQATRETQALRTMCSLLTREVENSIKIVGVAPTLRFRQIDYANLARLPATFPSPDPNRSPAYDVTTGSVEISYRLDSTSKQLLRSVAFGSGTDPESVILDGVTKFVVTDNGPSDLNIQLGLQRDDGPQVYNFSIHRLDS